MAAIAIVASGCAEATRSQPKQYSSVRVDRPAMELKIKGNETVVFDSSAISVSLQQAKTKKEAGGAYIGQVYTDGYGKGLLVRYGSANDTFLNFVYPFNVYTISYPTNPIEFTITNTSNASLDLGRVSHRVVLNGKTLEGIKINEASAPQGAISSIKVLSGDKKTFQISGINGAMLYTDATAKSGLGLLEVNLYDFPVRTDSSGAIKDVKTVSFAVEVTTSLSQVEEAIVGGPREWYSVHYPKGVFIDGTQTVRGAKPFMTLDEFFARVK